MTQIIRDHDCVFDIGSLQSYGGISQDASCSPQTTGNIGTELWFQQTMYGPNPASSSPTELGYDEDAVVAGIALESIQKAFREDA